MSEPAQPPIAGYAAIGDGRTGALVGPDGSIDWLCLPDFDGTPVLARVLDLARGGRATLAPLDAHEARRRYLPGTNVLETVFTTADGEVVVTDGMGDAAGQPGIPPLLGRRVEGRAGRVRMAWWVAPRFGDGLTEPREATRAGMGVTFHGDAAPGTPGPTDVVLTVASWGLGDPRPEGGGVGAAFELAAGDRGLLIVTAGDVSPARDAAEGILDAGRAAWERWSGALTYDGPWPEAVLRSALALKLLTHAPTGAMAAALTSSLPETPGGSRNWDYRYCWLRDASFVVDAFGNLGDLSTAERFLGWLERASAATAPRLQPFYRLDGGTEAPERELELAGYRGARPVRAGNGAAGQRQLGTYGDLMQSCALFHGHGGELPPGLGERLAAGADHVVDTWRRDDAGIWEISPYRPYTWSKMACWVALDRSRTLAARGQLPGDDTARWTAGAEAIRAQVERDHWSPERGAYVAAAGAEDLDAAVLLGVVMDYPAADPRRWHATLDRLDAELGHGSLLYRTTDLRDKEETFLPCAFWRVHALARLGRLDEAADHMDALLALASDVGLFSEEAAPDGRLWGNLPQALTHGALINAAVAFGEASGRASAPSS